MTLGFWEDHVRDGVVWVEWLQGCACVCLQRHGHSDACDRQDIFSVEGYVQGKPGARHVVVDVGSGCC